jgi:hypothetical protein
MCWQGTLLSKGTCRNFEEIPLTWLLTIRKSLSSARQVQALGGAFKSTVHSHNPYSCPSKTFINGRRNSNVSTWIKLSARFKTFLNQGRWCMWTKVVMEGQVLSLKTCLFARGSYAKKCAFLVKAQPLSLVYMQFVACSQPQQSDLWQGRRDF